MLKVAVLKFNRALHCKTLSTAFPSVHRFLVLVRSAQIYADEINVDRSKHSREILFGHSIIVFDDVDVDVVVVFITIHCHPD